MLHKPDMNKPAFASGIFPDSNVRIALGRCPFCNKEIKEEDFKDSLSKKEYSISGMCQECQDDFFE